MNLELQSGETQGTSSTLTTLLQIGPIRQLAMVDMVKSTLGQYVYVLQGMFGKTLNSQKRAGRGKAEDASLPAASLSNGAIRSIIVETLTGAAAFKFSYISLGVLFPEYDDMREEDRLSEFVVERSWRFIVGRASPGIGKFIAHLVAACTRCANYLSVKAIALQLQSKCVELSLDLTADSADYRQIREMCDPQNGITEESRKKASRLANRYIDQLIEKNPKAPLIVAADGSTNNPVLMSLKKTCSDIREGYIYIVTHLNYYFGVPIEFFESGSSEAFLPQWSTPSWRWKLTALKKRQAFKITLPTDQMADDYDACKTKTKM
jgi:hypothetical protein